MESALYIGTLRHRRFRPVAHEFRYELFMAFLDIDRIPELMSRSMLSSYNRFNWASFCDRDHFGDPRRSLRERLMNDAAAHGVDLPSGQIFLLTHLRYLGYNFNPISLFYCFNGEGALAAALAEVNNTFGESRNYWLSPANQLRSGGSFRFRSPKTLHVSPFMGMNLDYDFVLTEPKESLVVHMATVDEEAGAGNPLFDATLSLQHRAWTAGELRRRLLHHPWMTAKVIGGIHWQALRLYMKGVPVCTHPEKLHDRRKAASKHA
jgi:DUF1365 family protein